MAIRLVLYLLLLLIPNVCLGFQMIAGNPTIADCRESFIAGDSGDVAGSTNFDSETDASSKLAISSNTLSYTCDGTNVAYVVESGCVADTDTEQTIKFDILFEDITAISDGADIINIFRTRNDASAQNTGAFRFQTDVNGDIKYFLCLVYIDGGSDTSSSVDISGTLAANVWYPVVCYYVMDGSAGGVSMKVGGWSATDTGFDDDNDWVSGGAGTHRLGPDYTDWGDGASGSFPIRFRNYKVYKYDAR